MNVHSTAFPCVTDEWPFQDHLMYQSSVSPRDLNNECAEASPVSLTWSSISQEIKAMNVQSRHFLIITNEWPFQDHVSKQSTYVYAES